MPSDADFAAGFKDRVKVGLLQPEMGNAQVWTVVAPGADRVGLGKQVPPGPVFVDQVDDAEFLGAHRSASSSLRSDCGTRLEGILTVDALGEVKAKKEMTPSRID